MDITVSNPLGSVQSPKDSPAVEPSSPGPCEFVMFPLRTLSEKADKYLAWELDLAVTPLPMSPTMI